MRSTPCRALKQSIRPPRALGGGSREGFRRAPIHARQLTSKVRPPGCRRPPRISICIAPRRVTLHCTAPRSSTPHHTSPRHTTPRRATPPHPTSPHPIAHTANHISNNNSSSNRGNRACANPGPADSRVRRARARAARRGHGRRRRRGGAASGTRCAASGTGNSPCGRPSTALVHCTWAAPMPVKPLRRARRRRLAHCSSSCRRTGAHAGHVRAQAVLVHLRWSDGPRK